MENNVPTESTNGVQNKPVPLCATGEGHPYAPVDWPEPGDVWTWKVGNKVTAAGFYVHRSLIVPKRLQKTPTRKIWLGSKNAVVQFLNTEFPDADVDAFFASFTWDIPAELGSAPEGTGTGTVKNKSVTKKSAPKKEPKPKIPTPSKSSTPKKSSPAVKYSTPTKGSTPKNETESGSHIGKRTRKSGSSNQESIPKSEPELGSQATKRSRNSANTNQGSTPKKESIPENEEESRSLVLRRTTRNSTRKQLSNQDASISTDPSLPEGQTSSVNAPENNHADNLVVAADMGKESARKSSSRRKRKAPNSRPKTVSEMSSEDFDNYLNSLDDIISQPAPKAPTPTLTFESYLLQTDEDFARARLELSSLLSQDLSSLITSEKLPLVTDLSSKLRSDPDLTLEELSILDLILEIPMVSDDLANAKRVKTEASKFFGDLETNIALVTKLRNKYTLSKDKIAVLQAENEANMPTIQELNDQIAKLQSRRDELAKAVEENGEQISELSCTQKRILNSLPKIVNEVKTANVEKTEWEVKQKEAARQEEQILAKFSMLEGFSFAH